MMKVMAKRMLVPAGVVVAMVMMVQALVIIRRVVSMMRISKEIWKKNNKRNLLSNPQLSCKVVSV